MIYNSQTRERKEKRLESRKITGESVHHYQLVMNFNVVSQFKTQTKKKAPVIEKVSHCSTYIGKINEIKPKREIEKERRETNVKLT